MLGFLHTLRIRFRNLRRLRRKVWRERINDILSHYPSEYVKTLDEVLADFRRLVRTRIPWEIRTEIPHYFASGMHLKGMSVDNHVCWDEWFPHITRLHDLNLPEIDLLRDKIKTSRVLAEHGFRVAESLGYFMLPEEGQGDIVVMAPDRSKVPLPELLQARGEIFCKPLESSEGLGCMKLRHTGSPDGCLMNNRIVTWAEMATFCREQVTKYYSAQYVVEECVQQHPAVSAIYPHSVNTLRLWTLREKDGSISFLGGVVRMGSGGACIDNASAGGFFVPLQEDGRLVEQGFSFDVKAPFPMLHHPDTGLVFKDYQIPFFEETKALIRAAHKIFSPRLLALGWDIAITPEGPLVIEINQHAGICTIQFARGGLRPIYRDYLLPALEACCGRGK